VERKATSDLDLIESVSFHILPRDTTQWRDGKQDTSFVVPVSTTTTTVNLAPQASFHFGPILYIPPLGISAHKEVNRDPDLNANPNPNSNPNSNPNPNPYTLTPTLGHYGYFPFAQ